MSLLGAPQISAAATVILAVGAVITAIFAILAFRKQSDEVMMMQEQLRYQREAINDQRQANRKHGDVLDLQARELREALNKLESEAPELRRAQAKRVLLWLEAGFAPDVDFGDILTRKPGSEPRWTVCVRNTSELPVRNLIFSWCEETMIDTGMKDTGSTDRLEYLLPRGEATFFREYSKFGGTRHPPKRIVILAFSDAAGVRWLTRSDSSIVEEISPDGGADLGPLTGSDTEARPLRDLDQVG
jgi:hypothetical protein